MQSQTQQPSRPNNNPKLHLSLPQQNNKNVARPSATSSEDESESNQESDEDAIQQNRQQIPSTVEIQAKKPYLKISVITSNYPHQHLILYDRYRFHITAFNESTNQLVSPRPSIQEELISKDDDKKIKAFEKSIVYLNFQEDEQILIMLINPQNSKSQKFIWVYHFAKKSFELENYKLPSEISESIQIGAQDKPEAQASESGKNFSKFLKDKFGDQLNAIRGGVPKFKLLNSNLNIDQKTFQNGNQFEILYFPQTQNMGIISQKYGLKIFNVKQQKYINQIYSGSSKICTQSLIYNQKLDFQVAQKFSIVDPADNNPEYENYRKLYPSQFSSKLEFLMHQYVIKDLKTDSQAHIIQEKAAKFCIEISEGLFQPLDATENPFVEEFITSGNMKSMKTVFGINLKRSFEIYMIDLNCKHVQINLRSRMDFELLSSTRASHIYSITQNEETGIFVIATTNHNFMCFDSMNGSFIKVRSDRVLDQSVVPNRKYFLNQIFGEETQQIIDLDHIFKVSILSEGKRVGRRNQTTASAQFLLFFGKKALKATLSLHFKKDCILCLNSENDFQFYNQHYPYQIDRNMIIYSENDVYLNIPKQMFDFIDDTKKILKYRQNQPLTDEEVLLSDVAIQQIIFAKQTIINQFNAFLSLIAQNRNFDAAILLKMLNQTIIEQNKNVVKTPKQIIAAFLPKHFILDYTNISHQVKQQKMVKIVDKRNFSLKEYSERYTYPQSQLSYIEQNQIQMINFMVILKYLVMIRTKQEDPNFEESMAISPLIAMVHQQKIVQAYKIISMSKFGESYLDSLYKFGKLLQGIYEKDYLMNFYSQRKVIGLYNMTQQISRSLESQNVEQSDLLKILEGLYGPIHSRIYRRSRSKGILIEIGKQNNFQKSLVTFSQNYEQLQTFEYYLLVNLYCRIIETCTTKENLEKSQKAQNTIAFKMPKLLNVMEGWRLQKFSDLAQVLRIEGQYEYRPFDLEFIDKNMKKELKLAFYAYLGNTNDMLQCINTYQCDTSNQLQTYKSLIEFLFICKLFSEIKNFQKIQDKTQNSLFLQLMQLTMQSSKTQSKQKTKSEHLSLKMSLSVLNYIIAELNIFDPIAPLVVQCQEIVYKLVKKQISQKPPNPGINDKYPKFIVYLIQNINQININQLKERRATYLSLDSANLKTFNFIFESMAVFLHQNPIEIEFEKHKLIQIPDLKEAILNCIELTEYEKKLLRKVKANDITLENYNSWHLQKLNQIKLSIWKFIMFLWSIQCQYIKCNPQHLPNYKVGSNSQAEAREWGIRLRAVQQAMGIQSFNQMHDQAQLKDNHIYEIYFGKNEAGSSKGQKEKTIDFLIRGLLDQKFTKFVQKIPKILKYYAMSQKDLVYTKNAQSIETMIQQKYKEVYEKFRFQFGLKLNYSVRLIRDKTEYQKHRIQLIKRIDKKWFKYVKDPKHISQKLLKTSQSKGSIGAFSEVSAGDNPTAVYDQLNRSFDSKKYSLKQVAENELDRFDQVPSQQQSEQFYEGEFYQPDEKSNTMQIKENLESTGEILMKTQSANFSEDKALLEKLHEVKARPPLVPKLELVDVQVQTSLDLKKLLAKESSSAKTKTSKQKSEEEMVEKVSEKQLKDLEDQISPDKFIELQLQELDRQQREEQNQATLNLESALSILDKMLWKKDTKQLCRRFYKMVSNVQSLKQNANLQKEYERYEKLEKRSQDLTATDNEMTRSENTMITAFDKSAQQQKRKISPEADSTLIFGKHSTKSDNDDLRQSKTQREYYEDLKENEKIMYYEMNNRLRPSMPAKYSKPKFGNTKTAGFNETQNYKTIQNNTISQHPGKMDSFITPKGAANIDFSQESAPVHTSRFGKFDQLRHLYKQSRYQNYQTIIQNESNFEQLSGSKSGESPGSRKFSPEISPEPDSISRHSPFDDRKSQISQISHISNLSKFIDPMEHLENLRRQKSPLRRSHSAMFLRDMIQGYNKKEYYNQIEKTGKRTITQNLIKYNQAIMKKDFKNQTQRLNEFQFGTNSTKDISVLNNTVRNNAQKGAIIGQQVKFHYNNHFNDKFQPSAKSPQQIYSMLQAKKKRKSKPRVNTVRLIDFSKLKAQK